MVNVKNSDQWGGPWSQRKLDCVEKYLTSYLQAMKNMTHWDLVYIDAFSGSGTQHTKSKKSDDWGMGFGEEDSTSEFLEGSALRALKLTATQESEGKRGFDSFVFIDMDEEAIESLRQKIESKYKELLPRCRFECGDSNIVLPQALDAFNWRNHRGVIFIDPFKPNMTVNMLERVAKTEALDVWFLFPLSGIGRMMAKDEGRIAESWSKHLDEFYGSHEWNEKIYKREIQPTLFGDETEIVKRSQGYQELINYTHGWLKNIFGESNVLPPATLYAGKSPHFALFAAISSQQESAIKLWRRMAKYILEHN